MPARSRARRAGVTIVLRAFRPSWSATSEAGRWPPPTSSTHGSPTATAVFCFSRSPRPAPARGITTTQHRSDPRHRQAKETDRMTEPPSGHRQPRRSTAPIHGWLLASRRFRRGGRAACVGIWAGRQRDEAQTLNHPQVLDSFRTPRREPAPQRPGPRGCGAARTTVFAGLRRMARPGLEPGSPRFSVV